MRIYQVATTATTAASGDVLMMDKGVGNNATQISYANFCLNMPAISTTGSVTAGSVSATSGNFTTLNATLDRDYINAYVSATGSVTPGAAASAASAIGGTWTSITGSADFSVSANGKVTHGGTDSSLYFVNVCMSITKDVAVATATFQLYKTGVAIPGCQTTRAFSGSDTGAMSMQCLTPMGENDYLEVKVWATGGAYTSNVGTSIAVIEMT